MTDEEVETHLAEVALALVRRFITARRCLAAAAWLCTFRLGQVGEVCQARSREALHSALVPAKMRILGEGVCRGLLAKTP